MLVELQNGLTRTEAEATQIVIRDIDNEVLAVVLELAPGAYELYRIGDPEFPAILRRLRLGTAARLKKADAGSLSVRPGDIQLP